MSVCVCGDGGGGVEIKSTTCVRVGGGGEVN